eukprot:1160617-Pelagomonas_calceolata.AAC.5
MQRPKAEKGNKVSSNAGRIPVNMQELAKALQTLHTNLQTQARLSFETFQRFELKSKKTAYKFVYTMGMCQAAFETGQNAEQPDTLITPAQMSMHIWTFPDNMIYAFKKDLSTSQVISRLIA